MSQLMHLSGGGSGAYTPSLPARVTKEIERQGHHGVVAAAKVQAAAFVTHQALNLTAMLSAEEGRLIEMCPLAEPRLKAIGDAFAGYAAFEVQRFGL
jgi:hypothetical protein